MGSMDLSWLSRLGTMRFFPRGPAVGPLAGRFDGARRGQEGEYLDRRAYSPGDDGRRIDWKFYARSDRWTVREEREENHLRAVLLLDVSRSMSYRGAAGFPKSLYAMQLSAGLAHVFRQCRESFGWGFFDETLLMYQPPRNSDAMWSRFLFSLQSAPQGQKTSFFNSMEAFVHRAQGRGAVVVISDFLGPLNDVLDGLRILKSAWGDVCALQVLDPAELDLSGQAATRCFQDLESGESLQIDLATVQNVYRSKMDRRQTHLSRGLAALKIDFHVSRTDRPVDVELSAFLLRRAGGR